jgi:hypothetical protein
MFGERSVRSGSGGKNPGLKSEILGPPRIVGLVASARKEVF